MTPRVANGVCADVDPGGCARRVAAQIAAVQALPPLSAGPKSVLVLGASGGYGLAARTVAAFGAGAKSLGVSFEREPAAGRLGTPGWYNNLAFDAAAREKGLVAVSLAGDAFRPEMKTRVAAAARANGFEKFDLFIYSVAAPQRADPVTGAVCRSVIKPVGQSCRLPSFDIATGAWQQVVVDPASAEELDATVKVMGGEDWQLWTEALCDTGLLARGARTIAFSYVGPAATQPIYRLGTLGRAKEHLEATARALNARLAPLEGRAYAVVGQALATRASAVIPGMPLYLAALYRVMKGRGLHETCLDQMNRLFREWLCAGRTPAVDTAGRIRLDDGELRDDVQSEVAALLASVTPDNVHTRVDFEGYRNDFLALHGFEAGGRALGRVLACGLDG